MKSFILTAATRFIAGLIVLFSIYLLWRGHNEPGGGFVGGLIGGIALSLGVMAFGVQTIRRALRVDPRFISALGLIIALCAGFIPMLFNQPFLTGMWADLEYGAGALPLGTPFLFDIGVYITVFGTIMTVVLALKERL